MADAVLDRAVDLAREVAVELAGDPADVGDYLGAVEEGARLVSHRFANAARGYHGWEWTVTVARVPRGRAVTVSEAALLPGPEAVLAKPWVPWADRLRPGDVGPGDVLPFRPDDPRLVPGWKPSGDPEVDEVAIEELALARERILSPEGRDEAAQRWYRGSRGPTSPGALASQAACMTCGFLVPLQGSLGQVFGVCANEWSPDDGKVVSFDHGCGAHSQTDVAAVTEWPAPDPVVDDEAVEVVDVAPVAVAVAAVAAGAADQVAADAAAPAGADEAAGDVAEGPVDEAAPAVADERPADEVAVVDEAMAEPEVAEVATADGVVTGPEAADEVAVVDEAMAEPEVAEVATADGVVTGPEAADEVTVVGDVATGTGVVAEPEPEAVPEPRAASEPGAATVPEPEPQVVSASAVEPEPAVEPGPAVEPEPTVGPPADAAAPGDVPAPGAEAPGDEDPAAP